jgi:hypothetical protein
VRSLAGIAGLKKIRKIGGLALRQNQVENGRLFLPVLQWMLNSAMRFNSTKYLFEAHQSPPNQWQAPKKSGGKKK